MIEDQLLNVQSEKTSEQNILTKLKVHNKRAEMIQFSSVYRMDDGSVYKGDYREKTKRHGFGRLTWKDGSYYEGEWKCDKAHGFGILMHSDGDIYKGEWTNDAANGFGEFLRKDGSRFIGNWVNDKQHGLGEEFWPNGVHYKGDYFEGAKDGIG
jgi:hypothetical protein